MNPFDREINQENKKIVNITKTYAIIRSISTEKKKKPSCR